LLGLAFAGILYALLHAPDLLAAVPGAQRDVQAALQYVLTLECDAEGSPGKQPVLAGVCSGKLVWPSSTA
jgi:hypothetical protein